MSLKPTPAGRRTRRGPAAFDPAGTHYRKDGWTPERQVSFIEALAEGGCVDEACKRVGMGTSSAYALKRRADAGSFRRAWDAALDMAIERLSDAAFARAIKGVATPVFYKGEQVGERVRHDERLTMFLLRYRDPVRYGAWTDRWRAERAPDGAATALADAADAIEDAAMGDRGGEPPIAPEPVYVAVHAQDVADARIAAARPPAGLRATREDTDAAILKLLRAGRPRDDSAADVACGSSTSAADDAAAADAWDDDEPADRGVPP